MRHRVFKGIVASFLLVAIVFVAAEDAFYYLSVDQAAFTKAILSWSAPSSGGAVGYKVYRDNAEIADISGTSYADTGLTPGTTYSYQIAAYNALGETVDTTRHAKVSTLPELDIENGDWVRDVVDFVDIDAVSNAADLIVAVQNGFSMLFNQSAQLAEIDQTLVTKMIDSQLELLAEPDTPLTEAEALVLEDELDTMRRVNFGGHDLSEVFLRDKLTSLADEHWIAGKREVAKSIHEYALNNFMADMESYVFTSLFRLGYFMKEELAANPTRQQLIDHGDAYRDNMLRFFDFFPNSRSYFAAQAYYAPAVEYFHHFPDLLGYDNYETGVFDNAMAMIQESLVLDTSSSNQKRYAKIKAWELEDVKVKFVSGVGGPLEGNFHIQNLSDSFYFPFDPIHETRRYDLSFANAQTWVPVYKGHRYALTANVNPIRGGPVNFYVPRMDLRDGVKVTVSLDGDPVVTATGTSDPPEYVVVCDYMDSDLDGISDRDENRLYHTDPNNADSDGDGLTDYFEIFFSHTNPLAKDSNGNGVWDSTEDSDGDGMLNRNEQEMGMDPLIAAVDAGGYMREIKVLEDAEDRDTVGWTKVGSGTASLTNVVCATPLSPTNRALLFDGDVANSRGYKFALPDLRLKHRKYSWRMKFSADYRIVFHCYTTKGFRDLIYSAANTSALGDKTEIWRGLKAASAAGQWVTILRDIQRDIWDAQSDCDILLVDSFTVYGDGNLDDLCMVMYLDNDTDLLPDELELTNALDPTDPSDAYTDIDQDGLTNIDEFAFYLTRINDADSDDDGLNDGAEILTYKTLPLNPDTDGDGLKDGYEIDAGMDPNFQAVQGDGFKYEYTIQEDAENGDTVGWDVYAGTKSDTSVVNEVDPDNAANRVIRLSGSAQSGGYRLTFSKKQYYQFKISWRMKFSETYTIYISCQTNKGHRYAYYTASNSNSLGTGEYAHHGLGSTSYNGKWKLVHRDLQKDLLEAQPDCVITYVDAFLIRGSGRIDDLQTYVYKDKDRDQLPDDLELSLGLNPANAADALTSLDADSLSNVDEFLYYRTDLKNPDTDADGLNDGLEVKTYFTDPLKPDTDGDYLTDGEEVNTYATAPLNPDTDADSLADGYEVNFVGSNPKLADTDGDSLKDGVEVNATHTDPLKSDTDGDGLADGVEINTTHTDPLNPDTDADGMKDGYERSHGTDPLKRAVAFGGYSAESTVWEDAEDMNADSWQVTDSDPTGAGALNAVDPDNPGNRVINLVGTGMENAFAIDFSPEPTVEFKLNWRARSASPFEVAVKCQTSQGVRYLVYDNGSVDTSFAGDTLRRGIGPVAANVWRTFRRDLRRDLRDCPGTAPTLTSVNGATFRGTGLVDDIVTYAYVDDDSDLLPDELELSLGLNPANPADAKTDLDGDGVSNLDEFLGNGVIGNRAPVPVLSAAPLSGYVPLTVNFDMAGSRDPDGAIASYAWNVNGESVNDQTAFSRTFSTPGSYPVTLTVTDTAGAGRSASVTIRAVATTETVPPTVPANVRLLAVAKTIVSLGWDASTDSAGVDHYEIYRDAKMIGRSVATRFVDSRLTPGVVYRYQVLAADGAGNKSARSREIGVIAGSSPYPRLYVDPVNGDDSADGLTPATARADLSAVIAAAAPHTVIVLSNGTCEGHFTLNKDLVIYAAGDAGSAVFAARGQGRPLTISNAATAATIIEGVAIVNGSETDGGGLLIDGGSAVVGDCAIERNLASGDGGGVRIQGAGAAPTLTGCRIRSNKATGFGGGVSYGAATAPKIRDCDIQGNSAADGGGIGSNN